jgi:hypothetical protein
MAMVLTVSCQKNNTNTNSSFTFGMPIVETPEGSFELDSKAYIDPLAGSQMKWWEGDQMMIYNLDAKTPANSIAEVFTADPGCQGKTMTTFTGADLGGKKSGGFFAFYPADKADLSLLANNNRGKWSVDPTQVMNPNVITGTPGWENRFLMDPQGVVMAEVANDFMSGSQMIMRHIFGFANLRVVCANNLDTKHVTSITIRDKKVHLTGPIELNILDITEERLAALQTLGNQYAAGGMNLDDYMAQLQSILQEMGYTSDPDGYEVNCVCPDGVDFFTINNVKKYFVVSLRPGALVGGFDVVVTYADGTSETKSYDGQRYVVRPGWFTNVDVVL